jgi:hypothetical protein
MSVFRLFVTIEAKPARLLDSFDGNIGVQDPVKLAVQIV